MFDYKCSMRDASVQQSPKSEAYDSTVLSQHQTGRELPRGQWKEEL